MRNHRSTSRLVAAVVLLAFGACSSSTEPGSAPRPSVATVTPDQLTSGGAQAVLTVTGSGFVERSVVRVDGTALATTFVDSKQLTATVPAALLLDPRSISVDVQTAAPGGGTSVGKPITLVNAAPTITSIPLDTITAGGGAIMRTLFGTGFSTQSEVQVDGAPVATTVVSGTELRFQVSQALIASPAAHEIRVMNPAPGGGQSGAAPFYVWGKHPVLARLTSRGLNAGVGDFTLLVNGREFDETSVVEWNGAPRTTTFLSSTRLSIAVTNADLQSGAEVSLRVVSEPIAYQPPRETVVRTLTVRTPGATTSEVVRVPMAPVGLVWDEATRRFYVPFWGGGGALNGTVSAYDTTGTWTDSVYIGTHPSRELTSIAITTGGEFLYVGSRQDHLVQQVALPTLTIVRSIDVGGPPFHLATPPGEANTVAVVVSDFASVPQSVGLFTNGMLRGQHVAANAARWLQFGDSVAALYGALDASLVRYAFHPTTGGLIAASLHQSLALGKPVSAGNRLVGIHGNVVDPEQLMTTTLISSGVAVAVDRETGRIFILQEGGIVVHDLESGEELGKIALAQGADFGDSAYLVRWGERGLAYLNGTELVIVRSPIVAP